MEGFGQALPPAEARTPIASLGGVGRRLLLFFAFLLFTGAVAAVIAPRDARSPRGRTATSAAPVVPVAGPAPAPSGRLVTQAVTASPAEPPTARARVGDLLELAISVPAPVTLTIAGLNRFASGDQDTPARFSFIVRDKGTFPVKRLEDGAVVARLVTG